MVTPVDVDDRKPLENKKLGAEAAEPQFSELVLTGPGGQRSETYAALCRDFYL